MAARAAAVAAAATLAAFMHVIGFYHAPRHCDVIEETSCLFLLNPTRFMLLLPATTVATTTAAAAAVTFLNRTVVIVLVDAVVDFTRSNAHMHKIITKHTKQTLRLKVC